MTTPSLFEAIIGVNEDNFGWMRALTGQKPKLKPAVVIDQQPTAIKVRVGGQVFLLNRVSDIMNPRTQKFSYLWQAKTPEGRGLGITHTDWREVVKMLQAR